MVVMARDRTPSGESGGSGSGGGGGFNSHSIHVLSAHHPSLPLVASLTCRHLLFGVFVLLMVNCLLVYIYWDQLSEMGEGMRFFYKTSADEFLLFSGLYEGNIDNETRVKQQKQLAELFQPLMTENDVEVLMDILERFVSAMTLANLTFFMYGGTLIGSYRHHNLVPWDDDVDIFMRSADKTVIRKILSTIRPDYVLDDRSTRWKFYSKNSSAIPGVSWKWPFVDICFYKENSWKIWDEDPGFSRTFSYRKSIVFPLHDRPFGKLRLPAPIDPKRFLTATYSINRCKSNAYNHKVEAFVPKKKQMLVPCRILEFMYPFVHFNVTKNGTTETLRRGGEILGQWQAPPVGQN